MMKIEILGSGCPKCRQLEANATKAVKELNLDASIEKVTDLNMMMDMGVMITPALAVDGVENCILNMETMLRIRSEA